LDPSLRFGAKARVNPWFPRGPPPYEVLAWGRGFRSRRLVLGDCLPAEQVGLRRWMVVVSELV